MLNFQVYKSDSEDPWIVFIHGAGGSIMTWNKQIEAFRTGFNLLCLDLRDHGESKFDPSPAGKHYTFELIINDIKEVLDHLEIKKAHFITLSFGSVLVQSLTLRYPDLVRKVVTAGGIFRGNMAIRTFVSLARFFNLFLPYSWMYKTFSYLLMPKPRHQISRKIYWRQARKLKSKEYMRWVGLYHEFFQLLKQFFHQNIHFPFLMVMGSDDYVFLKGAKQFLRVHPKAALLIIPRAGHICNIDRPQDFNQAVLRFLREDNGY